MQVKVFTIRLDEVHLEIDQNSLNDFLETVTVTKSETHFIESETSYWSVLVHYQEQNNFSAKEMQLPISHELSIDEQAIFDQLKVWRSKKAAEIGIKNFMICHNSELVTIAINKPNCISQLRTIKGFGSVKVEKYGEDIIALLQ